MLKSVTVITVTWRNLPRSRLFVQLNGPLPARFQVEIDHPT